MARPDAVSVHLDASDLGPCRGVGTLRPAGVAPDSPIAFSYSADWWLAPGAFRLDPTHYERTTQPQYPEAGHQLAGVFTDAAPDRWGRMLLDYREQDRARTDGRKPRPLGEWDYLLGVNDRLRMGALRFADETPGSPFLDDAPGSVPPLADLRELEHAALVLDDPRRHDASEIRGALRHLLAPGSPMGGARPKTSFLDPAGSLWMAKFPSHNDRRDVGAWEYVLNRLAERAGIEVPEVDVRTFAGGYHTFLARRFDRDGDGREGDGRRMFASAMTMLGKRDGEASSYAEIAEAIDLNGAPGHVEEDLVQLFRRLVFNIVTGHRDDHLRNHGFLRTPAGWRLAPAYDLNPMPEMSHHELAVGIGNKTPNLETAIDETAPFCRLKPAAARDIVGDVRFAVSEWRSVARGAGLSRHELDAVSPAFMD